MQAQPDPEPGEIFFAFAQEPLRFHQGNLTKAHLMARAQLRRDRKIGCDHVRDFRITANGLAIAEQQNWLAVRRNLKRAWRDRFGKQIARVHSNEGRSVEARSHPVGCGGDGE